ncbi:TIM barrel protein [Aureisphaera galaxeae]|uniref:sugar phosphate isomerase/epimerase family protein n=1 Tax=Aureisphaera galaxeae TaxID=1538023 RepID=UPI00235003B3|nr:TIM barrel protein [Aureisphaera galaxeae]MDC8005316.1 TIM barrel protein [Aureisphaera galaxeae]
MKRFILLSLIAVLAFSCKNKTEETQETAQTPTQEETQMEETKQAPKLSLAQWSLHKKYQAEGGDPFTFAADAKALGFDAVEFVSQLYEKDIESLGFDAVIDSLKAMNEANGVSTVLVMVDHEGDLADPDLAKRDEAVEKHKKWIDATAKLGGHAIRVNTFGTNDPDEWMVAVQDGLKKISEYAATKNINVLCENHGWLSSDAPKLMEAINGVNMENCGTLPDFGNWCVKRKDGKRWGECVEEYPDYYEGIKLMMPAAKAVSAKSYSFDADGNEEKIDYYRMMQIVKDAGYDGHIGVEFEGEDMGEEEGILATKALIEKAHANQK